MPIPKPCAEPGCGRLVVSTRYCQAHARETTKRYDERRGSSAARGYTWKWRRARDAWLVEHSICVKCASAGRVVVARAVDHIIPHRLKEARDSGDPTAIARAEKLFWSRSNWQSLCVNCHSSVKQAEEAAERRRGS